MTDKAYPELPLADYWGSQASPEDLPLYTADQMRAYYDLGRPAASDQLEVEHEAKLAALRLQVHTLTQRLDAKNSELRMMRERPAAGSGISDEQIAALRDKHGITSNGRGVQAFEQVRAFVQDILASRPAPATVGEIVYRWQALDYSGFCYGSNPPDDLPARCNLTAFYAQPEAFREALHEISATGNLTATPQQFARHLQKVATDALAGASGPADNVAELRSALNAMLTYFGMDEDEFSKGTLDQARRALRPAAADVPAVEHVATVIDNGGGTIAALWQSKSYPLPAGTKLYATPPSKAPAQEHEAARHVTDGAGTLKRCASHSDGDCSHTACPQTRDNEPHATGRSCPIYNWSDDDARF